MTTEITITLLSLFIGTLVTISTYLLKRTLSNIDNNLSQLAETIQNLNTRLTILETEHKINHGGVLKHHVA